MQSLNIFWVWTITTSGRSAFLFCNKSNTFCLDLITLKVFDWLYFLWLIDISFILLQLPSGNCSFTALSKSQFIRTIRNRWRETTNWWSIHGKYLFSLSVSNAPSTKEGVGYINQFTYSSVYSQKAQSICNLHHFHL